MPPSSRFACSVGRLRLRFSLLFYRMPSTTARKSIYCDRLPVHMPVSSVSELCYLKYLLSLPSASKDICKRRSPQFECSHRPRCKYNNKHGRMSLSSSGFASCKTQTDISDKNPSPAQVPTRYVQRQNSSLKRRLLDSLRFVKGFRQCRFNRYPQKMGIER
jgi:hypothetical protein